MALEEGLLPDEYLPLLDELNNIVIASGVPLEGNLFYFHNHEVPPCRESVYEEFAPKRLNFAAACRAGTHMLEVGVNAGHSALLALANGVEYHGIDNCKHPYTRPAANYLKQQFGSRFHFYEGDSQVLLKDMPISYPHLRFNLFHIDGHHNIDFIRNDIANCRRMALKNAWIIIDDTDYETVKDLYHELTRDGSLVEAAPQGWSPYWRHNVARIP